MVSLPPFSLPFAQTLPGGRGGTEIDHPELSSQGLVPLEPLHSFL